MNGNIGSVGLRNIYPTAGQATLGMSASAATPFGGSVGNSGTQSNAGPGGAADPITARAMSIAALGQPLPWWLTIFAMLLLLGWASQKWGSTGSEFKNIKLSAYNVLMIAFASIIGISFFKVLFTRFPVPGLTSVLHAV